ncbi:MAG: hypothetical protein V9G12_20535 [Microthrixaceae bacterium]
MGGVVPDPLAQLGPRPDLFVGRLQELADAEREPLGQGVGRCLGERPRGVGERHRLEHDGNGLCPDGDPEVRRRHGVDEHLDDLDLVEAAGLTLAETAPDEPEQLLELFGRHHPAPSRNRPIAIVEDDTPSTDRAVGEDETQGVGRVDEQHAGLAPALEQAQHVVDGDVADGALQGGGCVHLRKG